MPDLDFLHLSFAGQHPPGSTRSELCLRRGDPAAPGLPAHPMKDSL
ncbi:hypothetical protein KSS93_11910 [Pseudomonas xanthosomatis]|nr:hypothetical protein [Pseudomonas xanthosomatis]QXH48564.1 hypothetical protein KSS93_11910 [Pseudomonas xanthosomatis]